MSAFELFLNIAFAGGILCIAFYAGRFVRNFSPFFRIVSYVVFLGLWIESFFHVKPYHSIPWFLLYLGVLLCVLVFPNREEIENIYYRIKGR